MYTFLFTCLHVNKDTGIPICKHAYLHSHKLTSIHTFKSTHIHTYPIAIMLDVVCLDTQTHADTRAHTRVYVRVCVCICV